MVKALFKIFLILAAVWCGYWAISAYGVRTAISGWFAAQRTQGWQAEYADISTTGFPFRHQTRLTAPVLADPGSGIAWQADHLALTNPAIWPGHVIVDFPDTRQLLSSLEQTLTLTAKDMQADLRLHPGSALELQRMVLTAQDWIVAGPQGALFRANRLEIAARQSTDAAAYALVLTAPQFTPGVSARKTLRIPDDWPLEFDALTVEMDVAFDRPWDRRALEDSRPQPRMVDIGLAEANWGALRLYAAGQLTVDAAGLPTGTMDIRAENWRDVLNLAQNSGALHPDLRDALEQGLTLLARLGRDPNILDLKLSFRNGYVSVGLVPIGPAPRLILR